MKSSHQSITIVIVPSQHRDCESPHLRSDSICNIQLISLAQLIGYGGGAILDSERSGEVHELVER
jgi:hypothetical protein